MTGEGKLYVGTLYIGGTHPAANGGAWMAAVHGLCGLQCSDNSIVIDPHLPDHWKMVVVPLVIRGQRVRIHMEKDVITFKMVGEFKSDISVKFAGRTYEIPRIGSITVITS